MKLNSNWKAKKFSEVAEVVTGSTPSTQINEYYGGDIPFVTPAELENAYSKKVDSSKIYVTIKGAKEARIIPKNSIMVCCIGSLGKVGIAGRELITNQQINSLIFNEKEVDPIYGYYYCITLKPYLDQIAPSTTVKIVNKTRFSEFEIPLPPFSEQKKIAAVLEKADQLRQKRKQANQKLDELLQSVFIDMFGDTASNSKSWKTDMLENSILFITSGSRGWAQYYSASGELFIRIGNVKNTKLIFDDIQYVQAPETKESERTKVQKDDLLISITADLGRTAVVDEETAKKGAYINQHLCLLRLNKKINSKFLAFFIESPGGKLQIDKANQVGVKSGLNFNAIKNLSILLPPIDLQNQFAQIVEKVEAQKQKNELATQKIDDLFNSLMQKAFKGELAFNDKVLSSS